MASSVAATVSASATVASARWPGRISAPSPSPVNQSPCRRVTAPIRMGSPMAVAVQRAAISDGVACVHQTGNPAATTRCTSRQAPSTT